MSEKSLQLPFMEIEKEEMAVRQDVRNNPEIIKARETYKVPVASINVREGFNARKFYTGIEELADMVEANGVITPITIDVLKDGRIYVERGHRRLKALRLLRDRYLEANRIHEFLERFEYVECFVNKSSVTELDRIKALYTSNHICPLSPVENSEVVNRMKVYYSMKHEEIASQLGISRQSVDNYAKIAELPDDVKQGLTDNRISLNSALSIMRKLKDEVQRAEAFENMLSGKTTKITSSPVDSNPFKNINKDALVEDPEKEDDKLKNTSQEVEEVNNCIQMVDKISVMSDKAEKQMASDIQFLTSSIQRKLEVIRDYLIKSQK